MKKKSNILKGFLATASLCGSLLSSFNANATSILTTGGNVSLNTGAGLVGGVFTNGATIQLVSNLPGLTPTISADKANAQIGGITTLVDLLTFGGVQVSQNTSIGPLNATLNLNPNFGLLKFIADNVTTTITGVGNQTFTTMDFAGHNSILSINDALAIATTIDNTSTTTVNGTLNLSSGVSITKDVGSTNSLLAVNFNGTGNINFGGIIKAGTITLANAANVVATGLVTGSLNYNYAGASFTANAGLVGSIDFKNNAGIFTLADGKTITGSINNGTNATLNVVGGTITGATNNLKLLQCSGGSGKIFNLGGNATISSIVFANNTAASGTIKAGGTLTLGGLTFNNGNVAGGVLAINAASAISGTITNGAKGKIQIGLGGSLIINDPSAGAINEVDIADGTTYTIDAKGNNVNLFQNVEKIVFEGQNSELDLINTPAAAGSFTLFSNLIPSTTTDSYGKVKVSSTTSGLTITNNGATDTIGQDPTHRLLNFIVDGSGNITINPTVFTSTLTVQGSNQATFNQPLDLGANGQIVYKANSTLVLNGVTGSIITNVPNQGTLTINSGDVSGTIGDITNSLAVVNVNANGNVTLGGAIYANTFNIDNVGANINAQGQITSNIVYNQPGTLSVNGDNAVVGAVSFKDINDTLNINIAATQTFAANIDNIVAGTNNGIVNINNAGNSAAESAIIKSNIGITNLINQLNINASGAYSLNVTLNGEVKASKIQINRTSSANPSMRLTIDGNITGDIEGVSNGTNNFVLNINSGKTITGLINSVNTASTTINFAGNNEVTGAITNATTINFNGANIKLDSSVNATNFIVGNAATDATIIGVATGNVVYAEAGSITTSQIIGDVNFENTAGTLVLTGNYTNTSVFSDATNATVQVTNTLFAFDDSSFGNVGNIIIGDNNNSSLLQVNSAINFTGNLNFASGGGTLLVIDNNVQILGKIIGGANATLDLDANLSISDPSAGTINEVKIADGIIYTIDAKGNNIDLFQNEETILFEGQNSELDLINSVVTPGSFTLYADLIPSSTTDGYGIMGINAIADGTLTITSNGEQFTIGKDATYRLQDLKLTGENNSSIIIDDKITIFTKLLSMNSLGQVTFSQPLDLGEDGTIAFGAAGALVVNGVTGSITTSANGQGTLTINSGNVNGTIGDATNSLGLVNIGANAVTFSANVFAPIMLTNNASQLTLANNVKVSGAVKTANDKEGVLTLGTNSSVTEGIGEENKALAQVKVGAGASSLGGDIYSVAVTLMDNTSVLTLLDGVKFNGSITNEVANGKGKLIFEKDGTIGRNIGGTGNALEEIEFNGKDIISGTVDATTLTINTAVEATITGVTTGNAVYSGAGKLTTGDFNGGVDFQSNGGTFSLSNNSKFDGTITSSNQISGTFNALGNGTVTGAISNLDVLQFSGDNTQTLDLQGNSKVNSVVFVDNAAPSGTINVNGGLDAGMITFNADVGEGNKTGGTVVINVASTVGAIVNAANGKIVLNVDFTTTDPNAGDVGEIDIKDGTTYTIDAINADNGIDLLNNGNKIVFEGPTSQLALINSSEVNDRKFTLFANLNALNSEGEAQDNYGIVRIATNAKDLTIANNGNDNIYTIGQDATHRLQNFVVDNVGKLENSGNIIIDNTVFTKLLSMNSLGQVTFSQPLDLGEDGTIAFGAAGALAVNGVTGSITTSENGQGTLTINSGNVTGIIGDATNSLAAVNVNTNGNVTLGGAINASTFNIDNAGANINAQGQITSNVVYNQPGTLNVSGDNAIIGAVSFKNANDALEIDLESNQAFSANIDNIVAGNNGIVNINQDGNNTTQPSTINSSIGITNPINQLIINNINQYSLNLVLNGPVKAGTIQVNRNIDFNENMQLTINNNIEADIVGVSNNSNNFILTVNPGKNIKGSINSVNTLSTVINLAGNNEITGAITNATTINFNGANIKLDSSVNATNFIVGNAATDATITGVTTGNAVYSGAGKLMTGDFNGGIDFQGNRGTFTLSDKATLTGLVNSTVKTSGTFVFAGDGTVSKNLGIEEKGLTEVVFNGTDTVKSVNATTLTVNDGADVKIAGVTTGNAIYGGVGILTSIGNFNGDIDFKGKAGTFTLGINSTIDGLVTSTDAVAGTLNFAGAGTVTKAIGTDVANSPALISVQGDNATTVALSNNVIVGGINFINGGKLKLGSSLTTLNIDFGENGGTLEFNGDNSNDKMYVLNSAITSGQKGTLNVLTTLTATNIGVGAIKTINIGKDEAPQVLTFKVDNANLTLLSSIDSSINFLDKNSRLIISNPIEQTVVFANSLGGFTGGGGIVFLDGTKADLIVDGQNNVTLGTNGNELAELNIMGNVTITNNLDVRNINELNIKAKADFTDQSLTSAQILDINIGEEGEDGAATYGLDATGRNFNLNTAKMKFANADSALNLENSSAANDSIITLTGPLNPGGDQFGKLQLTAGAKDLIINSGDVENTLGINGSRLKEIEFVSNGNGTINLQAGIFVEQIVLGVNAITLGTVNANVLFTKGTTYRATGDITGNINFQGKAGVINLADNTNINGTIASTGTGTLNFEGAGQVTGLITNIAKLQAGAGDISLTAGGNYSIGEIQGNGNNSLTFAANSNLTGGINTTGGQALNLIFTNGGKVSGEVGSNVAVDNITVQAGIVNFGDTIKSGNIIVANGATVQVNKDVTATDISGDNDNSGTLKLNNPGPINIIGKIGTNKSLAAIEVANSDATITGEINTQNINFSKNQATTLTLGEAANVTNITNITTSGNNIHTIAVTDFTANGNIGTIDNRLKDIELHGNGLVTINTNNFYSGVSTANNGQGNVKLNTDGAIAYDLGSKDKSLASVQSSGNITFKGDLYSMDITIDAGKTAIFDRGDNNLNPKTPIKVPEVKVDQDMLPRSIELFTYLTDVKSQTLNFTDATSSAEFKDAVLLDAPIDNGATIKFDKNVWLKEEIKNAQKVVFSADSFAILEKDIQAANLIADRVTLVLLNDIEMNANLNVENAILDLGTYELKHTGNVMHNGALTLITYYDTTLKTGGHVLVGNGVSVDMSGVDSIILKIISKSDITKIANGDRHEVVRLEDNATFTPAPESKITIDSSDAQNRFVKLASDNKGLVLIADDGTGTGGGDGGGTDGGNNTGGTGGGSNGGGGGDNTGGGTGGVDTGDGDNTGGTGGVDTGGGDNTGGTGGGGSEGGGKPIIDPNDLMNNTKDNTVANGIANQLINNVSNFDNTTDAGKLLNDSAFMTPQQIIQAYNKLGQRTDTNGINEQVVEFNNMELEDILTDVAVNMSNLASEGISGRLDELGDETGLNGLNELASTLNNNNTNGRRRQNQPQAAIAAGDEDKIGAGIWGVPFYSIATQRSKNDESGYKSKTGGGIIGADYVIGDNIILGAAYTRAESKLHHKNDKTGDRTKAISNVFSVYGLYHWLQNNLFAEFIGSYGRSNIKNNEKRITSTGNQEAISKFNNTSYSGELLGGYNYLMSNLTTLTPMLGVRYSTFKNSSYQEAGTSFQNLSVKSSTYNKFEGILGLKGATNILIKDMILRPELHGFINCDFKNKLPNIKAYLDGIDEPLTTLKFKPSRMLYNLGGGISTKYNMVELGIRYNLSFAKKYVANQGSLKIKVNL